MSSLKDLHHRYIKTHRALLEIQPGFTFRSAPITLEEVLDKVKAKIDAERDLHHTALRLESAELDLSDQEVKEELAELHRLIDELMASKEEMIRALMGSSWPLVLKL